MPNGEGMLKYENNDVFTGTFDHGVLNRKGRLALAEENGLATHGTKVSHVVMILTEQSPFSIRVIFK